MRVFSKGILVGATLALAGLSGQAFAADAIVGQWRAETGNIVKVASCGGSYCATIVTGPHKGKRIGQLSGSAGKYSGTVTDPNSGKTYNGSATIAGGGASLKLTGCALKIFCKSQTWSKL